MSGIRRPPRAIKPKIKRYVPLHHQILGKGQIELDSVEDLRYRLEQIHDRQEIEYEKYLECHEALDIREANAKILLDKATGKWVKPEKKVIIKARHVPKKQPKELKPWQTKLCIVFCIILVLKFLSFKP